MNKQIKKTCLLNKNVSIFFKVKLVIKEQVLLSFLTLKGTNEIFYNTQNVQQKWLNHYKSYDKKFICMSGFPLFFVKQLYHFSMS